jgi:tripartite-type tricarboxylate transporter receptor subunit TctC
MKKLFFALLFSIASVVSAQTFDKTKQLSVIVPFNPGGGTDLIFRNFQRYSERVGVSVIPIYKPGANGMIGVLELAKSPVSGYIAAIAPSQSVAETVVKNSNVDYTTITGIGSSLWVVVVNSKSGITSWGDLSAQLKSGKRTAFGSGATGQLNMTNQVLENLKLDTQPIIAPYNGAAPAVTDLIGGHIDVMVVPLSAVFTHIEGGSLRAVASIGTIPSYKHLPNLQKVFPNWKEHDIFGFLLPKGAKPDAVSFWNSHLQSYLADAKVREELIKEYTEPVKFGPASFDNAVNLGKALVK